MFMMSIITESYKNELMNLAIKKYGETAVKLALNALYKWTRGDKFSVNIETLRPLTVFKPKIIPQVLYKGIRHTSLPKPHQPENILRVIKLTHSVF